MSACGTELTFALPFGMSGNGAKADSTFPAHWSVFDAVDGAHSAARHRPRVTPAGNVRRSIKNTRPATYTRCRWPQKSDLLAL